MSEKENFRLEINNRTSSVKKESVYPNLLKQNLPMPCDVNKSSVCVAVCILDFEPMCQRKFYFSHKTFAKPNMN